MVEFSATDFLQTRGPATLLRALPGVLGVAEIPAALVVPGRRLACINSPLRERMEEDSELLGRLAAGSEDGGIDAGPVPGEALIVRDETFSTALRAYRVCEYAFLGLTEMRLLICRLVRAAIASPGYIRRRYGFTEQEARVAFHLAHGRGNQAIGRELGLTERTVRHHVERIMRKLNSGSRTEAAYRIWCGSSR